MEREQTVSEMVDKMRNEPQWRWLTSFVYRHFPYGLPSHLNMYELYWELKRSSTSESTHHMSWVKLRRVLEELEVWVGDMTDCESWEYARKVQGKLPAIGTPSTLMAICIVWNWKTTEDLKSVLPPKAANTLRKVGLEFLIKEPTERIVPNWWEGADFDSHEWRKANMEEWTMPRADPPPNINLNRYFLASAPQ